jgi:hypothetical protein
MLEASASVLSSLADYAILNPDSISDGTSLIDGSGIAWSGTYTATGWTYAGAGRFGGMNLLMNYAGTTVGADGSDVTVSFMGTGMLGTQPLLMNGSTTWAYDATRADYFDMEFAQETKIGAASRWSWVVGKEKIICVIESPQPGDGQMAQVIAGQGIYLNSIASLGKKVGYMAGMKNCWSPIDALGNLGPLVSVASSGKKGGATLSTVIIKELTSSRTPAPSAPIALNMLLDPANQGTLVTDDGNLYADDMFNRYRSTGTYSDTNGTFSGLTISVPEPPTGWLLGMAALVFAVSRRR